MSTWAPFFGFHRKDANTRTCWDYTFQLTPEHPTVEDFEKLKFSCDDLADAALERLNVICPPPVRRRRAGQPAEKPEAAVPSARQDIDSVSADAKNPLDLASPADPTSASTHTSSAFPPDLYAGATSAEDTAADPFHANPAPSAPKRDLYALVQEHAASDPALGALWTQLTTVPDWVDWEQIRRGQDVFYRYGGPCLTGLAFQSLLGGLGATRVVETLARTGGFATPVVRHRLYETTQHVLQVTSSPAALQPGGSGFVSSVRVRLLHAAVRTRIRALAAADPQYFDVARWGLPISDLDAAATIGTFSATLVWLALPRQGIVPTAREEEDYIALWRYVGHLVGAPTAPFASPPAARRFMESLLLREIAPSATGRALAANVLAGLAHAPPQRASPAFLHALTHWLNGRALATALGVPRPPWYYTALVAGQSLGFMAVCYLHRAVPALDRRKVAALRRVFWAVIVTGRYGLGDESVFEFKYIPQLGKTTRRAAAAGEAPPPRRWTEDGGVEWRSARTLLLLLALVVVAVYVGWGTVVRWSWERIEL